MTTPLIPDTMQGALTLSVIDFFLSFVVISFIGIVLTGFPMLNRIAGWVTARKRVPVVAKTAPAPAVVVPTVTSTDIPEEDVAAISAVLAALLGEHRILHIEPQQQGAGWLAAGRQAQHQSHVPPRHNPR